MVPSFAAPGRPTTKQTQYYEMLGHRAIWHDGWKAVTWQFAPGSSFDDDVWELYHADVDFAELVDMASTKPRPRWPSSTRSGGPKLRRYNALPLDDRIMELFTLRRPGSELQRNEFTFRLGTARIDRFAMPDLRNRSWTITAQLPLIGSLRPEGVLVAGGARTGGYSLYLRDGAAHFAFNRLAQITTVTASIPDEAWSKSALEVAVRFTKTGEYVGTVAIEINGRRLGTGDIEMLPFRQTLLGLHIGADHGSSVTDAYASPFRFTGDELVVRYTMDDDRSDLTVAAKAEEARSALADQ